MYAADGTPITNGGGSSSTPTIVEARAVPDNHNVQAVHLASGRAGNQSICRDCRAPYTLRPGENDCLAEFYKCDRCVRAAKTNFFEVEVFKQTFCTIS